MACRRMINSKITDDDRFLVLAPDTQALYMHLVLHADDDGFVSNPLGIVRLTGCQPESLEELKQSGFVIPFISGVLCITHWGQHNWIRKDRYTPSIHQEKRYVTVLRDRSYAVLDDCRSYVSHSGSRPDSHPGIPWDCLDDSHGEASWYDGPDDKWQPSDSQAAGKDFGREEG